MGEKKKTAKKAFDIEGSKALARELLGKPAPLDYVDRVEPIGERLFEFVLPLKLCLPFNRAGRAGTAAMGKMLGGIKKTAYALMRLQNGGRVLENPLPGRPHVLCVRFSPTPSDVDSGWSKNPIDRLRSKGLGLGILADDSRKHVKTSVWWEPCKRGESFVYVAVHSGEASC